MSDAADTTPVPPAAPTLSLEVHAAASPSGGGMAPRRLARLQTLCLALTAAVTVQQVDDIARGEGFANLASPFAETCPPGADADAWAFEQTALQICAQVRERARLYEAEQQARCDAEEARERAGLLQSVTARLSQSLSLEEVGAVIVDAGCGALGAHRGVLALLTPDGDKLQVARAMGYQARIAQAWQEFSINAPIPLADAAREGRAIWICSLAERDARYPQLARIQTSSHAYAVVPLRAQSRALGAISFGFDHARAFDEADRAFITSLAQHCALALERARLHDAATRSLADIETLNARLRRSMAETHHRVKNNLQVISALVDLQTDAAVSMVPSDALRRIGTHARALASLHDLLTDQARDTAETTSVSARALIGKMIPLLQIVTREHTLLAHIDDFRLPVRVGASLCLLVNELVSNSVKHGGRVVRLSLTGQTTPEQTEDGVAAPADPPDYYAEINALLRAMQAEPDLPSQSAAAAHALDDAGLAAAQSIAAEVTTAEDITAEDIAAETTLHKDAALFRDRAPLSAPPRAICLQIEDDGPGFAPGFDVRKAANTGLDLVVNISRLDMEGSVVFANHQGGGAQVRVTFTLPEN